MKRNIFPASVFVLILTIIFSISSDFSFAEEEHSLETHENETEKTSAAEQTQEEHHSTHEIEPSMKEIQDQPKHEHMDDTLEDIHVHNSMTAEAAQWIGVDMGENWSVFFSTYHETVFYELGVTVKSDYTENSVVLELENVSL